MCRRRRWISRGTAIAPPSRRYSGARKFTSRQLLPRREGAPKWYAERSVGENQLVARAYRGEHAAPFVDDFADRFAIGSAHVAHARGNLELALRIDEKRFSARRKLAFRGIHEVEHGDVVPRGAQPADGALHAGYVHEQVRDEHDHPATADEARRFL